MNRLYISVGTMFLDSKDGVAFWETFIHKYGSLKSAMEDVLVNRKSEIDKIDKRKKCKWIWVSEEVNKVLDTDCGDYVYSLVIHGKENGNGVWHELDNCCTLEVLTANVGG